MEATAAIRMTSDKTHQVFFIDTVLYPVKVNISVLSVKVQ